MLDVHIIGGGPCGAIAAIEAARLGKNVLVSEEHKKPGGKPCSCLLSLSGLQTLTGHLAWKESVENEAYGADIYFSGKKMTVERRTPVAAICDRDRFDQLCMEAAENEGVKIEYGKRVIGNYRPNNIIGADGANSSTAAFFGFPGIKRFIGTIQGEVRADWDEKKVKAFLSRDYPGFLGWIVPRGGRRFEVGCGVRLPNNAKSAFEKLEKRLGVSAANKKMSIIPAEPRPTAAKRAGRYDVRLAGDSAGQAKATTGGGILFGSWCARMAAKASSPLAYEIAWRMTCGKELFLHGVIRKILDTMDDQKLERFAGRMMENGMQSFLENDCDMEHASKLFAIAVKKPGMLLSLF